MALYKLAYQPYKAPPFCVLPKYGRTYTLMAHEEGRVVRIDRFTPIPVAYVLDSENRVRWIELTISGGRYRRNAARSQILPESVIRFCQVDANPLQKRLAHLVRKREPYESRLARLLLKRQWRAKMKERAHEIGVTLWGIIRLMHYCTPSEVSAILALLKTKRFIKEHRQQMNDRIRLWLADPEYRLHNPRPLSDEQFWRLGTKYHPEVYLFPQGRLY